MAPPAPPPAEAGGRAGPPAMKRFTHTVSAANRAVIRRILRFIDRHDGFLCTGHIRSDGDALGSQIAANAFLRKLGKRSHVVCDRGASAQLRFLPGAGEVGSGPQDLRPRYDGVFTFDSASLERLERIGAAVTGGVTVVNVDHHASNERFGTINWIDPGYAATGEMVYDLVLTSGAGFDPAIATNLYVTLVTDTGRFSFSNTSTRTHLIAAHLMECGARPATVHNALYRQKTAGELRLFSECVRTMRLSKDGAVGWVTLSRALTRRCRFEPEDTQEFIDLVKSVKGVRVAVLLRETGAPGKIKVSFRTERGVDGMALASKWGGGGHQRASGATYHGTLAAAVKEVIGATIAFVKGCR